MIKKKLVMNENGYILDIKTLKFTKIELESKARELLRIGRIEMLLQQMYLSF